MPETPFAKGEAFLRHSLAAPTSSTTTLRVSLTSLPIQEVLNVVAKRAWAEVACQGAM